MEGYECAPASGVRQAMFRIEAAAATHIGQRATNADAYLIDEAAGLYAVADGMGDVPLSFLVARTALEAVRESFVAPWTQYPRGQRPVSEAGGRLMLGVERAHGRLYAPWITHEQRIGTTFAGVIACGNYLCVGHVGDSRAYLVGSMGWLMPLTKDQTVATEVRGWGLPLDRMILPADTDKLTQAIGVRSMVKLHPQARRWHPGDMVLLCTDGLSDCLDSDLIVRILLDAATVEAAAQTLIDRAAERQCRDNATAVVLRRAS